MAQRKRETFSITDGERGNQPMIIGIEGPPGGGKTFSALRMAKGIQRVRPGPIVVVDSDNDRATAYADLFAFKHLPLRAPFRSLRYADAVHAANALKPAAIIVDSMSDEHEGIGGVLEYHQQEKDRMGGGDNVSAAAWIKPKAERLAMIQDFLQIDGKTPIILTFRARQKVKPMKNDRGKMEPTNIGWQPIAPAEITGNCTVLCLLPPGADGVPKWKTGVGEEDFVLKLPVYARSIFAEAGPLNEDQGEQLARWARGDDIRKKAATKKGPEKKADAPPSGDSDRGDGGRTDGAQDTVQEPQAGERDSTQSETSADDFPGDKPPPGEFDFKIVNLKGDTGTTRNGEAWADKLVNWLEKRTDVGAAETWKQNKKHVDAAEAAGHTMLAQRVWTAAAKRGLTDDGAGT